MDSDNPSQHLTSSPSRNIYIKLSSAIPSGQGRLYGSNAMSLLDQFPAQLPYGLLRDVFCLPVTDLIKGQVHLGTNGSAE